MKSSFALALAGMLLARARAATAQDWPAKTVKIIVPFGPGSTPDMVARLIGDRLQQKLGQSFVIENKPGASGNLGTDAVAKAEADGYTIGISIGGPLAINTLLFSKLPYDPGKDIAPVTQLITQPSALVVNAGLGVNSVAELVALLKREPGKHNFGSIGNGSLSHLAMEAIALKSGTQMVHVPYPGSPQAVTAVLRGDVQMACLPAISVTPQLASGKVKMLAVSTARRSALLPEIPTLKESGIDVEADAWMGLIAPAKTPDAVIAKIHREVVEAIKSPEARQQACDPADGTDRQFAGRIPRRDRPRDHPLVAGDQGDRPADQLDATARGAEAQPGRNQMSRLFGRCSLAALALVALQPWTPAAAQGYPSKPVTIIVPLAPGTGMDTLVRLYGEQLAQALGKPVVVENRPGAGLMLGTAAIAAAAPDGHTLGISTVTPIAVNPVLYKKLNYDPDKDLAPIYFYVKSPFVLVVNPALPIKSVPELIKYAKESASPMSYSTPGAGSSQHLSMEFMAQRFGLKITHVPYRSSPQSIADIAAGHVNLGFAEAGASLPLIREGKLRALAVSSSLRLPTLPEVPPFAEAAGAPDFEAVSWHILFAPAATPKEIIERLHQEMRRIMSAPDMKKRAADIGLLPLDSAAARGDPRATSSRSRRSGARW